MRRNQKRKITPKQEKKPNYTYGIQLLNPKQKPYTLSTTKLVILVFLIVFISGLIYVIEQINL